MMKLSLNKLVNIGLPPVTFDKQVLTSEEYNSRSARLMANVAGSAAARSPRLTLACQTRKQVLLRWLTSAISSFYAPRNRFRSVISRLAANARPAACRWDRFPRATHFRSTFLFHPPRRGDIRSCALLAPPLTTHYSTNRSRSAERPLPATPWRTRSGHRFVIRAI